MRQRNFWTSTVRGLKKFSLDFACFISLAQGQREMPHPLGRSQHEVWNVPNHKENFDKNVQMILAAWSYTYWQVPRFNSKNWLKLSCHVPGFYGKFYIPYILHSIFQTFEYEPRNDSELTSLTIFKFLPNVSRIFQFYLSIVFWKDYVAKLQMGLHHGLITFLGTDPKIAQLYWY